MYSYSPFLSSYPYSNSRIPPNQNYRPPMQQAPIYSAQPRAAYPPLASHPSAYAPPMQPVDYQRLSSTVEHYDPGKPQKQIWNTRIPYERAYVDYQEQRHIEYIPQERSYTDYIELEHQMDYIPVPQIEKRYEYLPVDRFRSTVDYMPVENSQVVSNSQYGYGQGGKPGLLAPGSPYQKNYY